MKKSSVPGMGRCRVTTSAFSFGVSYVHSNWHCHPHRRCQRLDCDAIPSCSPHTWPFFLCDRRVVEDHWLVERFIVPPERHPDNPLIFKQHPWEGTGPHLAGSVLRDPHSGKFHMWYSVWNRQAYEQRLPFPYNVCYAESDDGIQWRKPMLGVFHFSGSTQNNCVKLGTDKTQNIDVCWNPRPDLYSGRFLAIHNQKGASSCLIRRTDIGFNVCSIRQQSPTTVIRTIILCSIRRAIDGCCFAGRVLGPVTIGDAWPCKPAPIYSVGPMSARF